MKKPNINILGHDLFEWIEVEGLEAQQAKEAYENMIDALLAVNHAIENCKGNSGAVYLGDRLEYGIRETLKKAGCTE